PHAHAKIEALDTAAAEKMPGVKAVQLIAQVGKECFYAGDEVVALAADTEEHLHDALRAIKVKYQVLDHLVTEQDALKNASKKTGGGAGNSNAGAPGEATKGYVEQGFKEADAVIEGDYGVPTICHQCLESHGLVAEWDKDDNLTVWCSTQAVTGTAQALAQV